MASARTGSASVEFAVIAPVFLLLIGGILEFGQAFRIEHSLSNAARRGARSAIVAGATSSQVSDKVKADMTATLGVMASDVTVAISLNGQTGADLSKATEGDEVRVTVSVPFSKAGVGFINNTFLNSTLKSTCTLEHE